MTIPSYVFFLSPFLSFLVLSFRFLFHFHFFIFICPKALLEKVLPLGACDKLEIVEVDLHQLPVVVRRLLDHLVDLGGVGGLSREQLSTTDQRLKIDILKRMVSRDLNGQHVERIESNVLNYNSSFCNWVLIFKQDKDFFQRCLKKKSEV